MFQLLDRDDDYWSSYEVDLSDLELIGLFNSMGYKAVVSSDSVMTVDYKPFEKFCFDLEDQLQQKSNQAGIRLANLLKQHKISIPHNFSILATINTSDESIYYLDSAFKRRWDWEYIEAPCRTESAIEGIPELIREASLILNNETSMNWSHCIIGLNEFIKLNHQSIRRIEDKQSRWWFIKPEDGVVDIQQVKDKLMFYLWDNVFAKDRRPLEKVLSSAFMPKEVRLVTFAGFVKYTEIFIQHVESLASPEDF